MPSDCISYQNSGYFSRLIVDYLNQQDTLKPLYNRFPKIENFKLQIDEKAQNYSPENRSVLVHSIEQQYKNTKISEPVKHNISLLKKENTFTITTGHQLNLFTGPLYFLYKIISTINLTKQLKETYPEYNFVPVYWMATEDHDFEEINYFTLRDKKIMWGRESSGPVGRLNTTGLDNVLQVFSRELGVGENAKWLVNLFESTYIKHHTLAGATQYLANELFDNEGLVILDADSSELKRLFIPYIKQELLHQVSHQKVAETALALKEYNIQVNPREINLFYIQDSLRERIVLQDGRYYINNTQMEFSAEELLQELEKHPEKFSPNVIMRPLYQEVILPNLCYIGGGGELAYWLELKSFFDASEVTFPILLLRNSVLLATQKQAQKLDKLNLSWADMFMPRQEVYNKMVTRFTNLQLDFSEQKQFLEQQFEKLERMAKQTDASFTGAVQAQKVKQQKGLENLEKRLLKAEKKKHNEELKRIGLLQNELFPHGSLQERRNNFAEFYVDFNGRLMDKLFDSLNPLEQEFNIIIL
ncbi:bacillithiol biosynthesis cysteine-adding enzyme BshC [Flavobacterium rhizosphaerae]|uniref:Putative cysteine ligase BshC n=1 Tax=Flavobacterium rhizosphaerae TaxID=3163298 RepID=A0ABW8YUB3_9FLAO